MSTIEQCRGRDHIADENAGIGGGERGAGEIRAGQGDIDRGARIARIRGESRDRRRANTTRVARDGQQIANGVVLIRRDIPLSVDHLREAAQVVVDVLSLIGDRRCRDEYTKHQHAGHGRQKFG